MITPLARLAFILEHDGGPYLAQGATIQSEVEAAAARLGAPECDFRASGRTDTGVHARGQVIALRLPAHVAAKHPLAALNWHLPDSIRARRVAPVDEAFDPRRDAIRRAYRYALCAGQVFPPLLAGRMGRVKATLDAGLMGEAAALLRGRHDFRAWRSAQCQGQRTVLEIERLDVAPWPDPAAHGADTQLFTIDVECRSFLHNMVRYLVGGLVAVGSGKASPRELAEALATPGRLPPGVAPVEACGLSLERVDYPPEKDPFRRPAAAG